MTDSIHRRRLDHLRADLKRRTLEQALEDGLSVPEMADMELRWYRIGETRSVRRSADEPGGPDPVTTEANVYVYEAIGGSMGVTASRFAQELEGIDADVIHLRINSGGGSVNDAKAIMNSLRAHPARVISHVDGLAASAATIVLMAGDEVVVEPGGELMVHFASTTADGDHTVLGPVSDWIKRQSQDVAEMYAQRSGKTAEEWMDLMAAETWFYGAEAVEAGLADRAETLSRTDFDADGMTERMSRRHETRHFQFPSRVQAGAPAFVRRELVGASASATRRRAGVTSEVRDAARLRQHAARGGTVHRSAPAGVTTMRRESAPDGAIQRRSVQFRGREMIQTDGFFTVYGRGYTMWDMYGPYVEQVSTGAGDLSLRSHPDTCFLINHTGLALARTGGPWNNNRGTLNLEERSEGGWHTGYLNPDNVYVQALSQGIDGGVITEMSFAFMIEVGEWNDDFTVFNIHRYNIDRGDVSAVNFGASPHTNITARAADLLDELEQLPAGAVMEAVRRLGARVGEFERVMSEADPERLARIAESAQRSVPDRPGPFEGDAFRAELDRIGITDPDGDAPVSPAPVDTATAGGSTVAGYEALLRQIKGPSKAS
jgi:ATP-dependent protease ClpP protease subunit/phage head maturation protease